MSKWFLGPTEWIMNLFTKRGNWKKIRMEGEKDKVKLEYFDFRDTIEYPSIDYQ